jgi:hypothetical protein
MEKRDYLPGQVQRGGNRVHEAGCARPLIRAKSPIPAKCSPAVKRPALMQHGLHPLEKAGVLSRE